MFLDTKEEKYLCYIIVLSKTTWLYLLLMFILIPLKYPPGCIRSSKGKAAVVKLHYPLMHLGHNDLFFEYVSMFHWNGSQIFHLYCLSYVAFMYYVFYCEVVFIFIHSFYKILKTDRVANRRSCISMTPKKGLIKVNKPQITITFHACTTLTLIHCKVGKVAIIIMILMGAE